MNGKYSIKYLFDCVNRRTLYPNEEDYFFKLKRIGRWYFAVYRIIIMIFNDFAMINYCELVRKDFSYWLKYVIICIIVYTLVTWYKLNLTTYFYVINVQTSLEKQLMVSRHWCSDFLREKLIIYSNTRWQIEKYES